MTIAVYRLGSQSLRDLYSWTDNSHRSGVAEASAGSVITCILGRFAVCPDQVGLRRARQETEIIGWSQLKRLLCAIFIAGVFSAAVGTAAAHEDHSNDEWPMTCVDLNDIVEEHLGNPHNVGIYQNTFGDQAEAVCPNDHRNDVIAVFGWAIATETGGQAESADLELDWPTTCVELNDIVEGHLGNQGNVAIYQNTFGDQAEAACQNDHRNDVRSVFAWAIGTSDAAPPALTPPAVIELTVIEAEVPPDLPAYDRDQWGRWRDADGDCQDTRQEVLISESLVPATHQTARQCRVASGEWFGVFTGTTVLEPGALDIDHLVPLANAHRSGAWSWPHERKRAYYNSLDDADHLIAVTASANRSKGARGPEGWRPSDESYWCEYARDWIRIKQAWSLSVTAAEGEALGAMLGTCETPTRLAISSS